MESIFNYVLYLRSTSLYLFIQNAPSLEKSRSMKTRLLPTGALTLKRERDAKVIEVEEV